MYSELEFQFPSNGKVYSELKPEKITPCRESFNSLQTGKCIQRVRFLHRNQGFNSLQTGKCIPFRRGTLVSFNSLQTGKCIQTQRCSIRQWKFQFPSNGKVYSEGQNTIGSITPQRVSIPFKRESVFRGRNRHSFRGRGKVSIPFKRESVFRVRREFRVLVTSFNSLQTGKCIQTDWRCPLQFPSNGKVYSEKSTVSRPPSTSSSFNSLQTGKCIQSIQRKCSEENVGLWMQFQFPSNGKVYSEYPPKPI